ncbi:TPA: DUF551 domain-containing protein [Klebsiella aerogenes]|uniref:DUF551 domain-containing protein n=1 Tax=Klebsiella aerogenes TaxID=548 RepID=UPI00388DFC81|nr:DUF551 domain-containing protein [Klebsiella aerogenes]HCM1705822.1 DUF551 domain-containing protein [Klebsiella aerogenes]
MTKSTITRERLEELAAGQSGFNLRIATHEESQELACMALAAMDSESVILYRERNPYNGLTTGWQELTENELSFLKENAGENAEFLTLYRHAQPAPVVPEDVSGPLAHAYKELTPTFMRNHITVFERYGIAPNDSSTVIQALRIALDGIERRAAMLQAKPVTAANKLGNSPVIPDGLIAAVNHLLDSDGSRGCYSAIQCGDAHDEIERLLAAAPQDTPALDSVQSVVTVSDTWIPVSERMPEDEQEVLTINRMGHRFVSFFDKHSGLFFDRLDAPSVCCIEHVLVTHWMPLPAAPQEVKP